MNCEKEQRKRFGEKFTGRSNMEQIFERKAGYFSKASSADSLDRFLSEPAFWLVA